MKRLDLADRNVQKSMLFSTLKYVFLILYSITTLFPFLWVAITSLKDNEQLFSMPFSLPTVWRFENYTHAFIQGKLITNFLNSILYDSAAVFLVILVASMAAYILARVMPNMGLYTYFTMGIMVPVYAVIVPFFIILKNLGLINTRFGIVLAFLITNLSISIFILVGFMKSTPVEIEEAAWIDGCSRTRTFFTIVLPLSKPGLATVATLAFLNCWNDYLFPLLLLSGPKLKTLTQGVYDLRGEYNTQYGLLCAGLIIIIIPVVCMYVLFQDQVIKGMTAGAVKG